MSGTLATALGANEELAIYNGTEKLAAVTVNGDNSWSFTTPVLTDGLHTLKAVIQAADENNIANARVISAAYTITVDFSITAPTQTVTITAVSDDVSTHGSAVGALATGASTDDTMPTLTGTLSAALTADQVLVIYDGTTKLGEATVTSTDWTYTPNSALTAGSHSFTAQVKSLASNLQGMASAAHVVNINPGINMTVTDDVGDVTGALNPAVRYILLKQTGSSSAYLRVGEVEVFSGGENVALGKTVTAGEVSIDNYLLSAVIDGDLTDFTGYFASSSSRDNWLLIDLGDNYVIDSVNVYALSSWRINTPNVDIFASTENLSIKTYTELQAAPNAINLGGTGATPEYKTSVMPTVITIIDDNTPTLSGTLTTALGADEELAIYHGSTKLAVVNVNSDNSWTFTTPMLIDGSHTLKAVIQAADENNIANARVISAAYTIAVDTTAPTQTVTITAVSDDVSTHGSAVGALATGASTDDTMPTLTGTLSAALTADQVLVIYDGATKLGEATVTSTDWTYTPSALTTGSHSFTARVEDPINGLGAASAAHVVNINPSINMAITDYVGAVTGPLNSAVRYILLKQTGDYNYLNVNEVEVFSAGVNIASGKTVTAGYDNRDGYLPSGITDGSLVNTRGDGYLSSEYTTNNWLLIDLGAYYSSIDSVKVYSSSLGGPYDIRNVDIFASNADLSSKTYAGLQAATNAINLGGTGSTPVYKTTSTTPVITITDDSTPTLSGILATALGTDEELAIYNGMIKLAVVIVNGDNAWTFTPTDALTDGSHTFTAVIQAAGETDIANARVISVAYTITIDSSITAPTQAVTITAVNDDVSTYGSAVGDLDTGTTTDDTTPTLTGTLSAALIGSQVLAIYDGDGATKLGEATVTGDTGTDWTYTPSPLTAGSHSFTARVESPVGGNGTASNAHVVNINPSIDMTITDYVGAVTGPLNSAVRYILLKQTGPSRNELRVNEVEVFSAGVNVALGKTVTAGYGHRDGYLPSGITDGSLVNTRGDGYRSSEYTTDNWLLIDLGANYSRIDSVNVYALSSSNPYHIRDVDIFASTEDLSSKTYTELTNDPNAINLGGTGASPEHKTSLTTAINNFTDDSTPTLSGSLATALGADEELAIYHGTMKLGVATVSGDSGGNTWTFTPTDALTDGSHTLKAVIQAADETTIANARVISAASTITVDATAPTQTVTITAVNDDVSTYDSAVGALATGATTDDTTPTLTGTLSAALIGSQVLAIYDDNGDGDGATKLGEATITGDTGIDWTYTPSALTTGSHRFTARVESLASNRQAMTSSVHVININPSIDMTVTDDVGDVLGVVAPEVRYILLKQTGQSNNILSVREVEVFSAGVNLALGKTVTAGYGHRDGYLPSGVTDGSLTRSSYSSSEYTTDNWLLIDLGTYYSSIDSVKVYDSSYYARNLDIFASNADLSSKTYTELTNDPNAINLGGTGASPEYKTSLTTAINNITDDSTPTLSGILATALGADEELAIYNGMIKLAVVIVNGDNAWTFTPTDALTDGSHTFTAVIQAASEITITNARVISAAYTITIDSSITVPTQTVTITTVIDDVSTHDSVEGNLVSGVSTDDTTPRLTGTLSAALTADQVLVIYDGATKLGEATVTGTDWTYTPSALTAGSHSFTARVESPVGGNGTASSAHVVNINPGINMTVTDDVGGIKGALNLAVRYILLKQTGASGNHLSVGEVEVFSAGVNVALGQTVTAGSGYRDGYLPSGVTDGSLESTDGYSSYRNTTDNWLLIDLGAYYSRIDRVNVYEFGSSYINNISNVDIFASTEDLSSKTYTELTNDPNTINLGGTGASPEHKTSLTTAINNFTDDSTPTLSGSLATALGANEELAIYNGTMKLGVATISGINGDNSWSFTPTDPLADANYTFKAVIQAVGAINIAEARVISATSTITVDTIAPTQTVTITAVSDDVSTYDSAVGALATGATTDDATPTLTGTLSAALIGSQVLAIYDDNGDGATKLGDATITGDTGTDWTYTPSVLTVGSYRFTARVESLASNRQAMASNARVVNINSGIDMTVTDDAGDVTGALNPEVRYILLKQTGQSNNVLSVGEVEVFSAGVNLALGKTIMAGYGHRDGYLPSGITDGSLVNTRGDGYRSSEYTTDNWLLIDLGAYYSRIDSVNVYALSSSSDNINNIRNVDIFASNEDLSSKTYAGLLTAPNATPLGGTGSTPIYKTSLTTPVITITDDSTPTLSGILTTALGTDEELAIYHGTMKLGVATVSADNAWTFTPANALVNGSHTFIAVIQAAGETDIANARVISVAYTITIDSSITTPTQTATIVTVSDDVSTHGSVMGALADGATTDDTTPTLAGTLSAALTADQVLVIYDGATKLGEATVTSDTGTDWIYTPSALAAGSHSFTARVESPVGGMSTASAAHVININPGISILEVRYILLKQTGASRNHLSVGEVEVFSAGVNVALGQTVTAGSGYRDGYLPSGVTDGSLESTDGYSSYRHTTDNWLLIDLGAYYSRIDRVKVYALSSSNPYGISNVDIFASTEDLSSKTYTALTNDPNAINLGGTGASPEYKTSLTTPINNITDDSTPTLSGSLATALGVGEELAIYHGTMKLGVAIVSGDNSWTFTTPVLTDGSHTFTTVIQVTDETDIANARVISAAYTITIVSIPTTVTIVTVSDDVSTHDSIVGVLSTDTSTDDTTPTLTGTLSTALTADQVLAIYDNDGATKLGDATITGDTGTNWTYTPSALAAGSHSFTAQVESLVSNLQGTASNAYVVNVHSGTSMTVTDDAGVITGSLNPEVRYILLKQTGALTNSLSVGEVEVFSAGVNLALGKTVTAGSGNQHGNSSSGVTDGRVEITDGYHSNINTADNWVLVDLGGYYRIDSVNVYALSSSGYHRRAIRNVDIFVSNEDISSQTYAALTNDPNAINLGGTGSTPAYKTSLTTPVINNFIDDTTPTLSGILTTVLGAGEELAIYHGTTKFAVVTVNGDNSWAFTPTNALANGLHTFTAVIQATDETAIANARVISAASTITIVIPPATIVTVSDSVSTHGSAVGALATDTTTDDTTPTLAGTLSAALTDSLVLAIYHDDGDGDGATKLGNAFVTGTNWTYTSSTLTAGSHRFTVRVENPSTDQQSSSSNAYVVNVNGGIDMTVTDNVGVIKEVVDLGLRYILLKQTGDSTNELQVGEVEVFSAGANVALGKTVRSGYDHYNSSPPSDVTDGSLTYYDSYRSYKETTDNWVLIDLGDFYSIDSINVYGSSYGIRNVAVFASNQDISSHTYARLLTVPSAIYLGGTGSTPTYKTSLIVDVTEVEEPRIWARYILLKQTGDSTNELQVGEVEVFSAGANVALGKTVRSGDDLYYLSSPSDVTDGSLTYYDSYRSSEYTTDNWVLIDLGDFYSIDSINVYGSSYGIRNVAVFASNQDISHHTYAELTNDPNAIYLGGTGSNPAYKTSLTTPVTITDDSTPTLSGILATALGADEELAIYNGMIKLAVAIVNGDNAWTFTPTDALMNGSYTLKAVIQAIGETDIANARVISAASTIEIDSSITAPRQTVTITAVNDDVSTYGSAVGALDSGATTDDTTPTLTGTLSAALTPYQVLVIYDGDGATKLGNATITGDTGTNWTYTPSPLTVGSHSFTAQVESSASPLKGLVSSAHVVNINPGISSMITVTDDVGPITGVVVSEVRYILLKQTGKSNNQLRVSEVKVYSANDNIAEGKTVTAGYGHRDDYLPSAITDGSLVNTRGNGYNSSESTIDNWLLIDLGDYYVIDSVYAYAFNSLRSNHTAIKNVAVFASTEDLSHQTYAGLLVAPNAINLGGTGSSPEYRTSLTDLITITDDSTPTLSGTLPVALVPDEELAIYHGMTKLTVVTVNTVDNAWTFTPTDALINGRYAFTAVIQAAGETDIANARVISATSTITVYATAPTQAATIVTVSDDVSTHRSVEGNLVSGVSTDDTTPTLTGTLSAALTAGQVLVIYDGDGATKLGEATITGDTGTNWTYTPSPLTAGSHHFTAQVENSKTGQQGTASSAHMVNINPGINMTITDDVGDVTGALNPAVRYILLKQTGDSRNYLNVHEVEVFSGDFNIALGKTVTAGSDHKYGYLPSTVTDGKQDVGYRYRSSDLTTNNWVLIDLGDFYSIDSINVYGSGYGIRNVAVFASNQDISHHTYYAALLADPKAIHLGHLGNTAWSDYKTSLTPDVITMVDDNTPTFSGTLTTALSAGEELAIYHYTYHYTTGFGINAINVVTVSGNNAWTFTPTNALTDGWHRFTAVIQAVGATDIANARVISAAYTLTIDSSITAPTKIATIATVNDDVSTYGSAVGALDTGTTTDDTTPTLTGTLSAALTAGQKLVIYDGNGDDSTKLGDATITGNTSTSWTYTPSSALTAGSYRFTARVDDPVGGKGPASTAHVVNIYAGISMTITSDVGDVTGALNPEVRYILLKQTGDSINQLLVNEVEVFSAGVNIALGKTVTAGYDNYRGHPPSAVTDGSLESTPYRSSEYTTNNWLLIDLGAYYSSIDRVNIYALSSSDYAINNIRNVDIFASNADLSSKTYEELTNISNAINLGGTGSSPAYKTSLTTPVITITDDSTPILSGTLTTALGANEELAIYHGITKLDVATVSDISGDNSWTFTPTDALTDGSHTFTAVIQVAGETDIANARVISAAYTITIDSSITTPTQTVTITTVIDDVSTHDSVEGNLVSGVSTDDTTPRLTGTLSAALTADQVLVIYDGATKLGEATVTGTDWTYTPSALTAGNHSFTAQVKSLASNLQGMASTAHVVNIYAGISMTITDDVGDVTGALNPELRYILLKQTGASRNYLSVNEVEVFSAGVNIALGKTVTVGTGNKYGYLPSAVTDGSLGIASRDGYASIQSTTDNWVFIDLGAYYSNIDRVNVYALDQSFYNIRNVDIFASNEDLSSLSYEELQAAPNAINLGGTGATPEYKTSVMPTVITIIDDNTPTLSGTLTTALGADEELAIYHGSTKLAVVNVNSDNSWTFTTPMLIDGEYTFKAVIQATDNTAIADGRVLSAAYTITVEAAEPTPASTAAQGAAASQEALYSSYASSLEALEAKVEAKDPISGLSVQTYSLPSTAKDQTLDFPDEHTEINVVNIAGSGANTVKIQLDDVLQSGINLFNDANGWDDLDGAGKHQLVVNGDADDTLVLDTIAEAGSWIKEGTTTNSDHTYLVYSLDSGNVNGISQLLVDQDMIRDGAIL